MLGKKIKSLKVRARKAVAMGELPNRPLNAWEGEKYFGKPKGQKPTPKKKPKTPPKRYYA